MLSRTILMIVLLAAIPAGVFAFDNQRPGFTLELSAGVGRITASDYATADNNGSYGFLPSVALGWGLTDRTALQFEIASLIYSPQSSSAFVATTTFGVRQYLNPTARTVHVGLSAGLSFDGSRGYDGTPPMVGYVGGVSAGYLFGQFDSQLRILYGRRFLESDTITMMSFSVGYLMF